MNCTVCGNPLLFDRVVFHCSCGAFVHAYCWNEHVLQAHQPTFEVGAVEDGFSSGHKRQKKDVHIVYPEPCQALIELPDEGFDLCSFVEDAFLVIEVLGHGAGHDDD